MASNRVGNQIAAQLMQCGNAVSKNTKKAVDSASFILKSQIQAELQRAVGADQRMSNVGKSAGGAKLDVRYDIKGTVNPTSLLRATGPWGLIEYDTAPHEIAPRAERITGAGAKRRRQQRDYDRLFKARGRYSGLRPMPVAPGIYRYEAQHKGTTGKRPFAKGMEKARPRAMRELNTVILRGVANVWNSGRDVIATFREE